MVDRVSNSVSIKGEVIVIRGKGYIQGHLNVFINVIKEREDGYVTFLYDHVNNFIRNYGIFGGIKKIRQKSNVLEGNKTLNFPLLKLKMILYRRGGRNIKIKGY